MHIHSSKTKKGFTLIELMVSVGLFTIVMTISMGIILSIVDGNKRSQAINSVSNNLNFAVDSMVRDIKTGYNYRCNETQVPITDKTAGSACTSGVPYQLIVLLSTIGGREHTVEYMFVPPAGNAPGSILKKTCDTSGACDAGIVVTSPEINIKDMAFYVKTPLSQSQIAGGFAGTAGQPAVFLYIQGTAKVNPTTVSDFNLQTFISQRVLNI